MHLTAFAYLDPGSGSLLIQSVIGVVAGIGIFGRRVIAKLGHRAKVMLTRSKEEAVEE